MKAGFGITIAIAGLGLTTAALAAAGIASTARGDCGFSWALGQRSFEMVAMGRSPDGLAEARRLDQAALRQSPYDNTARLRLVLAEPSPPGRLGALGAARIAESYELFPIDYTVAAQRLRVALEHWDELDPATQTAVRQEILVFSRLSTRKVDSAAILGSIRNPAGAVAAAGMLREINR